MSEFYFEILNVKENEDGSATIEFEVNEATKNLIKRIYNRKRFSKKLIREFIIDGIKRKGGEK